MKTVLSGKVSQDYEYVHGPQNNVSIWLYHFYDGSPITLIMILRTACI